MPVERELGKILAMPDDDLIRWRKDVRKILDWQDDDAQLSALYEASLEEIVSRAGQAWSAASAIRNANDPWAGGSHRAWRGDCAFLVDDVATNEKPSAEKENQMPEIEPVERTVQAGREHRDDMARWLALEVLMTDEVAVQDTVLAERLSLLQEVIEERLRIKTSR
jgi:hypothetical protein